MRPIGQQPLGDERHGVIQQRVRPVGGDGLPCVALVADPDVAVVVVAAPLRPFGQAHCGRGDHPTPGAGQAAQHGVGAAGSVGAMLSPSSGVVRRHAASVATHSRWGSGGGPSGA